MNKQTKNKKKNPLQLNYPGQFPRKSVKVFTVSNYFTVQNIHACEFTKH